MDNLPVSWAEKRLREITTKPQYGYTASASAHKKGPKFVRITDITKENVNWETVPYCECSREIFQKYKLELKDLLFARTGSTGSSILITNLPEPAVFASYLIRLKIKKGIEAEYLNHFFKSWFYWKQIESLKVGAVQSGINASVLASLKIPVPPLVEHRGIVEVLGTVDECIRLTDAVIERAEELKRGLMQQLLTRGIGHTEYKETQLGKIPKTWKISTFGKECNIGTGGTPRRNRPDYYNGNIPWVKSTELDYGIIFDTEEHISKRALEESNAKIYPTGTLLIAMYGLEAVGTRGRCAILGVDAATNQAIAAIQPKKQILPRFLYYYYQQMGNLIMKYAEGTKRKNLSLSIIKKIPIIVPPITEQGKIVNIIENQDDIINLENQKINQLNTLKQGLIQLLLSGKTRVELKGDGLHRI